jgi:hypothetical protein
MQTAGQKEKCKANVHELAKFISTVAYQWNPNSVCNLFMRTKKPINRRASLFSALVKGLNTKSNVCGHRPVSNCKPDRIKYVSLSIYGYARFLNLRSQQMIITDKGSMALNEDIDSVFILYLLPSSFHLFCAHDNFIP